MQEERIVLRDIDVPDIEQLRCYAGNGGYSVLRSVRASRGPDDILNEIRASGLCDRSGVWAPLMGSADAVACACLCVQAHELEPGLFRRRKLMERNPHQLLEGVALAAYAVGASVVYLTLSSTMRRAAGILADALQAACAAGLFARAGAGAAAQPEVHLLRSPAAYLGAESRALLNGLEGHRPEPTMRPQRLFGERALVVDADTLVYLPHVVRMGAAGFRALGTPVYPGTCVCCISGHVRRPGLYEVALGGGSLRELIDDCAGGVREGHQLKAVLVGGVGGCVLAARQLDVRLAPEEWSVPGGGAFRGSLNTGSLIVMDETTCMVQTAGELLGYCARECCGQCPSCRAGTHELAMLFTAMEAGAATAAELERAERLCARMASFLEPDGVALCGLDAASAWLAHSFLERFREEFEAHLGAGACPVDKDDSIKMPETVNVRF